MLLGPDDDFANIPYDKSPAFKRLLEEPFPLHAAAERDDLLAINHLVRNCRYDVNKVDHKERTPLYYASTKATIDCLLNHYAQLHRLDCNKRDVISYLYDNQRPVLATYLKKLINSNEKQTEYCYLIPQELTESETLAYERQMISIFRHKIKLDSLLGFNKSETNSFYEKIKVLLQKALSTAKEQGKKLLIILGETHYSYPIMRVEKAILKAASELGIKSLLDELDKESLTLAVDQEYYHHHAVLLKYARDKLDMHLTGIDREHSVTAPLKTRNIAMKEEILNNDEHAVALVGSHHLHGLLEDEESRITSDKKHYIIPFQLSNLSHFVYDQSKVSKPKSGECYYHLDTDIEKEFSNDATKIIQIRKQTLSFDETQTNKVIAHWNLPMEMKIIENNNRQNEKGQKQQETGKKTRF